MPSPVRPPDSSRESVPGCAPSRHGRVRTHRADNCDSAIELPISPPVLTPNAARVLIRMLLKASRMRADGTVHHTGETDALAS
jgi:hypothetical protein